MATNIPFLITLLLDLARQFAMMADQARDLAMTTLVAGRTQFKAGWGLQPRQNWREYCLLLFVIASLTTSLRWPKTTSIAQNDPLNAGQLFPQTPAKKQSPAKTQSKPAAAAASTQPVPPPRATLPGSTRNSYSYGYCTWYVATRRAIPPHWGNAKSWYYHAQAAGWGVGTAPAQGAIAWTPAGRLGHVAYVEKVDGSRVLVSEMNYKGWNKVDQRWVAASAFKYIY